MQVLAQRIDRGQPLQLGDHVGVPAQVQIGFDSGFHRVQAQLSQPGHLPHRQHVGLHVRERHAAPPRERRPRLLGRLVPAADAHSRPRGRQQALEPGQVQLIVGDTDQIPMRLGDDPLPPGLA